MRRRLPFICLGVFYGLCNVAYGAAAFYPVDVHEFLAIPVFFAVGISMSGPAVLAVWGVLGSGHFWSRMAASVGTALLLLMCWVVMDVISQVFDEMTWNYLAFDLTGKRATFFEALAWHNFDDFFMTLLSLPVVFLAVQFPLWPFRLWMGWRIQHPDSPADSGRAFSIRDMMIATLAVAVVLASSRFAVWFANDATEFWLGLLLAVSVSAGISLVMVLSLVVIVLGSRGSVFVCVAMFLHALAAVVIALSVLLFVQWLREAIVFNWLYFAWATAVLGFATGLGLALVLARRQGYRLTTGQVDLLPSEPSE